MRKRLFSFGFNTVSNASSIRGEVMPPPPEERNLAYHPHEPDITLKREPACVSETSGKTLITRCENENKEKRLT